MPRKDQDLLDECERVLTQARGRTEACEVYAVNRTRTPVRFEDSRLKGAETTDHNRIVLRVVVGGRLGLATTTQTGEPADLLEKALANATFGGPCGFDFAPPATPTPVDMFSPDVPDYPLEFLLGIGQEIVDTVRDYDPRVLVSVEAAHGTVTTAVATSTGFRGVQARTEFSLSGWAELTEGQNFLHVGRFVQSGRPDIDRERFQAGLVNSLRAARRNVPVRNGRYPVIFTPYALADLLGPVLASVNGQAVERGFSPWRQRLGEAVLDERLSIYDDATMSFGAQSAGFDDEGIPTRRLAIIDHGRLASFLLDLRSAAALALAPTGTAQRGLAGAPAPGVSNLLVAPGDVPAERMLASLQSGLVIERLQGAWAGNPYSGDVAGNVDLGFWVENGEITGRVKDAILSFNAFEVLRHGVMAISAETDRFAAWTAPWILVDGAAVSTKA